MKIIIHAPAYMAAMAATLAARELASGALDEHSIIGIVRGVHCFTIKRNKVGASVWHFLKPEGAVPNDGWEA